VPAEAAAAVAALRVGASILVPTDTVYGLAADAASEEAVARLYRLKGRDAIRPTAVVFTSVAQLIDCVPGLDEPVVRSLLPGQLTLVVPNPTGRYRWVCGARGALGVRVPVLRPVVADILEVFGPVVATSANLPGASDPCRLDEVPEAIASGVAVALDGGELPGIPSTVVDLSGAAPRVLREGAVPAADVLARVSAARAAR